MVIVWSSQSQEVGKKNVAEMGSAISIKAVLVTTIRMNAPLYTVCALTVGNQLPQTDIGPIRKTAFW